MLLNNNTQIKVVKLKENAALPTRGSNQAAGYDLYACLDGDSLTISPQQTVLVGTGLAVAIPDGFFGAIFARSGLASKKGLRPANCVGVCDSDYRGEYIVALYNDSDIARTVSYGDRIAQLVLMPYYEMIFTEETLSDTDRGAGGFGSTGSKN